MTKLLCSSIIYLTLTHIFASGVVRGGRSPAAGCRQPKAGAGQRLGGACGGVAGVFGLGSLRWLEGWKRSSPKAQPLRVGVRLGALDWLEFWALARAGRKVRWKRSKPKAQP